MAASVSTFIIHGTTQAVNHSRIQKKAIHVENEKFYVAFLTSLSIIQRKTVISRCQMSVLTPVLKPRLYFENTDIYPNCVCLRLQLLILSKIKCTYQCIFLFSINSDIINHHQQTITKCPNIDNMSTILKCFCLVAHITA